MNIHHLELFYFVAKHGGIAAAVRNIPYGIQQPAVSGQIAKLEESLGTKLFHRRPFALSPAGMELFEFIKPFFDNIEIVSEKLRQNRSPQLRIAAPSIVLHDYVPELLQKLRTKFPEFRLYLHEAARAEAERLLLARDVDLAITLIEKKARAGIQVRPLLELPLILLVHRKSRLVRPEELWKRDKIEETLISLPRTDPIHASFQHGLERIGVEWFCGIEVNSARLIERYAAGGYGIGLAVAVPGFKPPEGVRVLELPEFPPVVVGASWSGKLSNISKQLLAELETEAHVQMRRIKSGARTKRG
jgi:DNA-binding transcriptional LysR family regulator